MACELCAETLERAANYIRILEAERPDWAPVQGIDEPVSAWLVRVAAELRRGNRMPDDKLRN